MVWKRLRSCGSCLAIRVRVRVRVRVRARVRVRVRVRVSLLRQLLSDVARGEDGLEVLPHGLHLD